ncbi:MAG: crotonase/enoyl-CoA hydratase family protein [Pseudomonadota bacterium]
MAIRVEHDGAGIATLWLARAEKHNALDAAMITGLTEAATSLGSNRDVRVVLLRAEGRTFCAGGDLGWMQAQMKAERATRMAEAGKLAKMLGALDQMPKPLIGVAQGNAFGGGVGLLAVCDVAIAATGTLFGLTETRLGLIPATIGPYVVARLGAKARQVFSSPRLFDADEALSLGLIAQAVPADTIGAAMAAHADPYLMAAPGAVARAKALGRQLHGAVDGAAIDASIQALADQWETREAEAGIKAFFDKTKPPWMPRDPR